LTGYFAGEGIETQQQLIDIERSTKKAGRS